MMIDDEESKTQKRDSQRDTKRNNIKNKGSVKIQKNSLSKEDYSFYYESSVWDQYEDFVYAIQRGRVEKVIM